MKPELFLRRLRSGHLANVTFADFVTVVEGFGFRLDRTSGSHHIYQHRNTSLRISLQSRDGEAKPYQVRQFLRIVELHGLQWDEDDA
jgi:predicted RNA binding protein YcfA (HicA-like mRNA interferase family)